MRTFIFSNCKKSSDTNFEKNLDRLNLNNDDKFVFLNHCTNLYNRSYFNKFSNIYVIMRAFILHGTAGYFGQELAAGHRKLFKNVFLFHHPGGVPRIEIGYPYGESKVVQERKQWYEDYVADTKKTPTTGYASYFLIQDLLNSKPEDIFMVNFYGSADNSTPKCEEHDWRYEEKKLVEMKVNKIFV